MADWSGKYGVTPSQNMQNVKQLVQGQVPYADWMRKKKKTVATVPDEPRAQPLPTINGENPYASVTISGDPTSSTTQISTTQAGPSSTEANKSNTGTVTPPTNTQTNTSTSSTNADTQTTRPPTGTGTPPAEVVRPGWAGTGTGKIDLVGLMPGTGLYAEAVKYNQYLDDLDSYTKTQAEQATVTEDGTVTQTGDPVQPKGLTLKMSSGPGGGRMIGGDVSISAEALAAVPEEARKELEALAARGSISGNDLLQFRLKYWNEPWAQGLVDRRTQTGGAGLRNSRPNMSAWNAIPKYDPYVPYQEDPGPPQATGGDYGAPTYWGPQQPQQPQQPQMPQQQIPQGMNPILWAYLQQMLGGGQQ